MLLIPLRERWCYLKYSLGRPHVMRETITYILARCRSKLRRRFLQILPKRDPFFEYPASIKRTVSTRSFPTGVDSGWLDNLPETGWSPGTAPPLDDWRIPLASHDITFQEFNWQRNERDIEDAFALHRFTWLLRWLAARPSAEALMRSDDLILDWIHKASQHNHDKAWDTYSACERVVNWLIYLAATRNYFHRDPAFSATIARVLIEHLTFIANHLEYYDQSCNNHILNNARALYIGGRMLRCEAFSSLGEQLFLLHSRDLINDHGELMEGSSHYQLLATRAVLEMLWASTETGDRSFAPALQELAARMWRCCVRIGAVAADRFDYFPLIGDVSPDYPVPWFCPDARGGERMGSWWSLWSPAKMKCLIDLDSVCEGRAQSNARSSWLTASNKSYFTMIPAAHGAGGYPGCHGHLDFGSFVIYDPRGPLLVDRGRESYRNDPLSLYGFCPTAHNCVLIDGLPLIPYARSIFKGYEAYAEAAELFALSNEDDRTAVVWRTNAPGRLRQGVRYERRLSLAESRISCLDVVSNIRNRYLQIDCYLHWAPGWELCGTLSDTKHGFAVTLDGRSYAVAIAQTGGDFLHVDFFSAPHPHAYHFSEYGRRQAALTARIRTAASGQLSLESHIRPI